MRHFLVLFVLVVMSLGNTGSAQSEINKSIARNNSINNSSDYNLLIKTSEEMYKTSQELLEQAKHLP